jgi:thiamine monophosphate synthase
MTTRRYDAAQRLARRAARLEGVRADLPALFAFTDPARTPDPVALARRLPRGCGMVLRTFGRREIEAAAFELSRVAQAHGLYLTISADPELALRCGADGVHWPQARLGEAKRWRRRFKLMTASAHDPAAARRAQGLTDLVFVSQVFSSNSPSAGRPIGPFRIAAYARRATIPVYALGGITAGAIRRLERLGISGAGAIGGVQS